MRDLRYAFRTLRTTPFVNAVAILSLALGIGANAAIYSLFDQVLLRPLPVEAPEQLVNLKLPGPIQGSDSCNQSGCGDGLIWSYPMLRDLERTQTALAGIAGHRIFGASIALGDEPAVGEGIFVTGFGFPVVPHGTARLRCQISAAHSRADLDHAVRAIRKVGLKTGVIK